MAAPVGEATVAMPAAAAAAGLGAAAASPQATQVFNAPAAVPAPVPVGHLEDDEPEEPRRGRAAGYVLLALAVIAVIAGGIWLFTQVLDRPEDPVLVSVPDLTNSDRATAKAALEDAGPGLRRGRAAEQRHRRGRPGDVAGPGVGPAGRGRAAPSRW